MKYSNVQAMLKGGKRPAGMDYKSYSAMAKAAGEDPMDKRAFMSKAEDEGSEADEEEDEAEAEGGGGEDEGEETEKSEAGEVDGDALSKALDAYEAVEDALGTAGGSRVDYLQARLDAGTISKSERAELGRHWAAEEEGAEVEEPIRKSVSETLADTDPEAADLVDASEFLQSLVKSVDDSVDSLSTEIARDGRATREFIRGQGNLIKALVRDQIDSRTMIKAQADVIDALATRLGIVERTPAQRKSVSTRHDARSVVGRPLAKSAVGGRAPGEEDQLTKSQVAKGFSTLIKAASEAGDEQAVDRLAHATAKWEGSHQLAPNMEAAIRQALGIVNS